MNKLSMENVIQRERTDLNFNENFEQEDYKLNIDLA